jgi:hypothetical protein
MSSLPLARWSFVHLSLPHIRVCRGLSSDCLSVTKSIEQFPKSYSAVRFLVLSIVRARADNPCSTTNPHLWRRGGDTDDLEMDLKNSHR